MKGRYESGPTANGYGVVFRYVDSSNFYYFIVSADGKWGLARFLKGTLDRYQSEAMDIKLRMIYAAMHQ
jgi:hypothetical protein